jgi:hypothetical protein
MTQLQTPHPPPHTDFDSALQESLAALRAALIAALEALPAYPRNAPDLARTVGLERNIAWKMFSLVHKRDVLAAARLVPGPASIATFVAGAGRAGVPQAILDRVAQAAESHQRVVRLHAGDRASADIMLGSRSGEAGELALRRAAFRSMSYLAGVQAQAQFQTFMFAPSSSDPAILDGVSLNGFVELRRMRPDAPVVIGRAMATDDKGKIVSPAGDVSLDGPLADGEFVPLLRDFCSRPLPTFRRVQGERGFVENELAPGPIGKIGATSFGAGSVIRSLASRYRDADNANMDLVARVRTPAAVLVCDVLAHEEVFGDAVPRLAVYSDLFGSALMRGAGRERYRLPTHQSVEVLGAGPESAHSGDIPRYTSMLRHVMGRLSWDGRRFRAYRARIEYPFTPTCVVVSFDLLDPPRS